MLGSRILSTAYSRWWGGAPELGWILPVRRVGSQSLGWGGGQGGEGGDEKNVEGGPHRAWDSQAAREPKPP